MEPLAELIYVFVFYVGTVTIGSLLIFLFARRVQRGLWSTPILGLTVWIYTISTFIGALSLSFLRQSVNLPFDSVQGKFVAVVMIVFGIILHLRAWQVHEFSYDRLTAIKVDRLFTSGPYSYVRNPMYVAMFLIYYGFTIFLNSFYFLIYSLLLTVGIHFMVLTEEKGLQLRFGEEYLQYKRKAPRYIPKLKHRSETKISSLKQ